MESSKIFQIQIVLNDSSLLKFTFSNLSKKVQTCPIWQNQVSVLNMFLFFVDRHSCIPQDSFTQCLSTNETILLKHESSTAKKFRTSREKKLICHRHLLSSWNKQRELLYYLTNEHKISILNKCFWVVHKLHWYDNLDSSMPLFHNWNKSDCRKNIDTYVSVYLKQTKRPMGYCGK